MDGWMDGWMDGKMGGKMDGWMNKQVRLQLPVLVLYLKLDRRSFSVKHAKQNVSMTRKCHNHILQTNLWHHKEESKNNNRDMTFKTVQNMRFTSYTSILLQ